MTAMTAAWVFGPFLAVAYAVLALRGATVLERMWERRHPSGNRH
jgi:predicted outer membrane lipoprotein